VIDRTRRLGTLVCALTLAGAAACSGGDGDAAGGTAPDREGDRAATGSTAAETGDAPFATGRRTLTMVDTSRPTAAVPGMFPERPERTLVVDVVYPAAGDPGPEPEGEPATAGAAMPDAPPADGAHPLVVFAHGWNGRTDNFLGFAERWAREGYVVALPTFPLSQEGIGVQDLASQPGDVSFVIDELAGLDGDDPLAGHVDVDRLAVGGHSLGSATTFGVAYNSCCLDERIDATFPVSGGNLPIEGGDYENAPATPMLLVHGVADEGVPIAAGDAMFELTDAPVWYLRAAGATHMGIFADEPGRLFNEAVIAFLDAQLEGDTAALDAFGDEVPPDVGEWRVKPG
jgi:dienelactone hydrolase